MNYQQIKMKVREVLEHGGFSPEELLDSIRLISRSDVGPISREIGSYSSALAFVGAWDRAEGAARSIRADPGETGLALSILAQRLAAADLLERAEVVVRSIPNSEDEATYEYEVANGLTKTTYADNTFTSSAYNAASQVVSTTDARGNVADRLAQISAKIKSRKMGNHKRMEPDRLP